MAGFMLGAKCEECIKGCPESMQRIVKTNLGCMYYSPVHKPIQWHVIPLHKGEMELARAVKFVVKHAEGRKIASFEFVGEVGKEDLKVNFYESLED